PGSNRHGRNLPQDFKSCASAIFATPAAPTKFPLERKTGFEPATISLARRYSTTELLPQIIKLYRMVRVKGVEPPRLKTLDHNSSASAASVTPYYFVVSHTGF